MVCLIIIYSTGWNGCFLDPLVGSYMEFLEQEPINKTNRFMIIINLIFSKDMLKRIMF